MPSTALDPARLHADGVAAFGEGRLDAAAEHLRGALRAGLDPEIANDLAVVEHARGNAAEAKGLLRACLAVAPDDADARRNLDELEAAPDAWRASPTLGGDDPRMPERAHPGMASALVMSEHAVRYGMTLGLVGGLHVLDLGCGTGYGSEMLSWVAASVRGFDLWRPAEHERPRWPGGAQLTYGHDLCAGIPLPRADAAVMFEVIEHLHDAPAALRAAWAAVPLLVTSFPNPVFHGSHLNHHHVNDWSLERFEHELRAAAGDRFARVELTHLAQAPGALPVPGRDPDASFWIVLARGLRV